MDTDTLGLQWHVDAAGWAERVGEPSSGTHRTQPTRPLYECTSKTDMTHVRVRQHFSISISISIARIERTNLHEIIIDVSQKNEV